MKNKIITLFGGAGFVGSHIIKILLENGFIIRVITHDPVKASKIKVLARPGYLEIVEGDILKNSDLIEDWIRGSDIVINLIGSFKNRDVENFSQLHSKIPEKIAQVCKKLNVEKLIHFSNLNIENIPTIYAKSRFLGEKTVLASFEKTVVLKSSLIYGHDDNFLRILFKYAKKYSSLPSINNSMTKMQPIFVEDLAKIVLKICLEPENYNGSYQVGGKEILTLKDIYDGFEKIILKKIYRINFPLWTIQAVTTILNFKIMTPFNRILFGNSEPPFYSEQLKMSKYDNIILNQDENLLKIMNIETKNFQENLIEIFKV